MKQFIYHGPTTSATIYGSEVVLADGKTYHMDPNSPLVKSMLANGQLFEAGAEPAVEPAEPAEPEEHAELKADIAALPNKAAVIAAVQELNPAFEPARETRETLEAMLLELRIAAATEPAAAAEPADETETN